MTLMVEWVVIIFVIIDAIICSVLSYHEDAYGRLYIWGSLFLVPVAMMLERYLNICV